MIINPKVIIEKNIVENLDGESYQIQQNGIDLTLDSVEKIVGGILKKETRNIYDYIEMEEKKDGVYELMPGAYSIQFQQKVEIPENMCAQIIQRSTLNRMGGFILSGVYDSGFKNQLGAVLRVDVPIVLQKGARVAQIVFSSADSASMYEGVYQNNE